MIYGFGAGHSDDNGFDCEQAAGLQRITFQGHRQSENEFQY